MSIVQKIGIIEVLDFNDSDRRGMNFLLDMIELYQKPILLTSEYIVGADRDQNEAVLALRKKNVLTYPSSRRSARVLARLALYSQYLKDQDHPPHPPDRHQ